MSPSGSAGGEGRRLGLIVAMDQDRLIGRADGSLPWKLPNDMAHFKRTTMGKTVLMGRKTWASLGRPLPGRPNWVLSRDPAFAPEGARRFESLESALAEPCDGELMIIGGADLYRQSLARAQTVYLTEVLARVGPSLPGDVHFPAFERAQFREVASQEHPADDRHPYAYRFVTLERA
ncbi:dihydrofolate reductase [Panacagrimonas perspica]|uniref:Dihydrofolate reductase n=1 Tax=Panacagrimonas perspica TaxID=381431 RepID=A0A4R7PF28_9GAMM|nr:dihydrofolate reductase [Panacagrimonas perspica]TDU32788.1 dihydrofolate reductase [Panacagrimonas perspica]